MPGLEPEPASLAECWCCTSEAGGRGSVAQGWSPWHEGQSLAAWREIDDRHNSDFHV